jgi:hypothetical protein
MSISEQRCFNHAAREAVARCPECRRYFCRECISEHEDRMVCAQCLKRLMAKPMRRHSFAVLMRMSQIVIGIVLLWSTFYLLGRVLLTIPTPFHKSGMTHGASTDSR